MAFEIRGRELLDSALSILSLCERNTVGGIDVTDYFVLKPAVALGIVIAVIIWKYSRVRLRDERHTYPKCKHGVSKRELCIECRNETEKFFNEPEQNIQPRRTATEIIKANAAKSTFQVFDTIPGTITWISGTEGEISPVKKIPLCECGHYAHDHNQDGCVICLSHQTEEDTDMWCSEYTPNIPHVPTAAEKVEWDHRERQRLAAEEAMQRTQDIITSNKLLVTCVTCGTQFYRGGKCVCYPH